MQQVTHSTQVKTEDGITYSNTVFNDDIALDRVKRLRDENVLDRAKFGMHDGADLRLVISCPSVVLWNYFKRDHAKTYELLNSKDETERMMGAREMRFLHPEWCIMSRL